MKVEELMTSVHLLGVAANELSCLKAILLFKPELAEELSSPALGSEHERPLDRP